MQQLYFFVVLIVGSFKRDESENRRETLFSTINYFNKVTPVPESLE